MKYFVIGDVHGCLNQMKQALSEAGFDPDNENHTLISLGDNFDRGGLSRGVYKYLTHLPRVICIKGNHEHILEEVFSRGYMTQTDIYNGVASTIGSFSGMSKSQAIFTQDLSIELARKYSGLEKWLADMPPYFETEHYIFTHGWLPYGYYQNRNLSLFDAADWYEASWINTEEAIAYHCQQVKANGADSYKTIVVGHWHTWRLHREFEDWDPLLKHGFKKDFSIYEDKENKVIGIDSCTNLSKRVNVLVVED
ncbi:MAG: metallophosphoesterase [Acetobacter sp.]|nr:metallophosphoesterase [Acetobacter sp.]